MNKRSDLKEDCADCIKTKHKICHYFKFREKPLAKPMVIVYSEITKEIQKKLKDKKCILF